MFVAVSLTHLISLVVIRLEKPITELERPTTLLLMATMRTYGDRCGVARALDIVGERWALLVVRELVLGPKRYTDLRAGLPRAEHRRARPAAARARGGRGGAPGASSPRRRARGSTSSPSGGRSSSRWSSDSGAGAAGRRSRPRAPISAFRRPRNRAQDALRPVGRRGPRRVRSRAAAGRGSLPRPGCGDGRVRGRARGAPREPDATIEGRSRGALSAVLWHRRLLGEAERSGELTIEGSRPVVTRLLGLFPAAPEPV